MPWVTSDDLSNLNTPSIPTSVGRWYSSPNINGLTTLPTAPNKLYAIPVLITREMSATAVNIEVTVQSSGNNARLGLYYDSNGTPGNLILDAGLVSMTGTGNKQITISANLPAGWYWLALCTNGVPTLRANSQANALPMLGFASGTDTTIHIGYTASFSYGTGVAMPTPFPAGVLASGSMPRVLIGF